MSQKNLNCLSYDKKKSLIDHGIEISKMLNVSNKKIWGVLDKCVEAAREFEDYSAVSKVGVDETSLAKCHNYISMFIKLLTDWY